MQHIPHDWDARAHRRVSEMAGEDRRQTESGGKSIKFVDPLAEFGGGGSCPCMGSIDDTHTLKSQQTQIRTSVVKLSPQLGSDCARLADEWEPTEARWVCQSQGACDKTSTERVAHTTTVQMIVSVTRPETD